MTRHDTGTSTSDLAGELNSLGTGLGIITMTFFPFAFPVIALTVLPLALVAIAGAVVAAPIALPVWLVRRRAARRDIETSGRSDTRSTREGGVTLSPDGC
jgi:membrane protein implicated in regulation of membrane protease activity